MAASEELCYGYHVWSAVGPRMMECRRCGLLVPSEL